MEIKIRKIAEFIGSTWLFIFTLLLFVAEASWLALTSRFPMAFDEAYHFDLIQFFSHRLNPLVTSQTSDTFRFGAIIQDPSFLYHYLMSFPLRFIEIFSNNVEIQVISLRFINIALAVASLIFMRKLLRSIGLSVGLTNILILAFALTPIVTVLSAQINYDNLLILCVNLCVYETILFAKKLDERIFDTKILLTLICLLLFSSLVKFSFLPIFLTILLILIWKIASYTRLHKAKLVAKAKESYYRIGKYFRLILLTIVLLGSFLFVRFYIVNLVEYHNPVPQCNQVLSVQDCKHYYSWNNNYNNLQYKKMHPNMVKMNTLQYSVYWFSVSSLGVFGEIMPLQGLAYVSTLFTSVIGLVGGVAIICTIVNFKKMIQNNKGLLIFTYISLIYVFFLWVRNYHDYLYLGQASAIDGRYLIPILIYFYTVLGSGIQYAFASRHIYALAAKVSLAMLIIFSFVIYGGCTQYVFYISPIYGQLANDNNFSL